MTSSNETVYERDGDFVVFRQLGVKVEMDTVSNKEYYEWLDETYQTIGEAVPGAQIAEKEGARRSPPLNTAIYYDTPDYAILPTGGLLRTSCNTITHAFCAFKAPVDDNRVRRDNRFVFSGDEKATIQRAPDSPEAVACVRRLLERTDVEHPGIHAREVLGIDPATVVPTIRLDDLRYTFFVWLDRKDSLRCSIDRFDVTNLRLPEQERESKPVAEVELSIYPRIDQRVAADPRTPQLIDTLAESLQSRFGVSMTTEIKYQRSARALDMP